MWKNTVSIHIILKKKNYKVKFLTSSILKKNKKKKKKEEKKNALQITIVIHEALGVSDQ